MNKIKKLIPLLICAGIMLLSILVLQRDSTQFKEEKKNDNEINFVSVKKSALDSLSIVYRNKTGFQLETTFLGLNIFCLKIRNLKSPADFLGKDYNSSGIKDSTVTSKNGFKISISDNSPFDVTFQSNIINGFVNIPVAILFKLMEQ
jgi:hypothetical protein